MNLENLKKKRKGRNAGVYRDLRNGTNEGGIPRGVTPWQAQAPPRVVRRSRRMLSVSWGHDFISREAL